MARLDEEVLDYIRKFGPATPIEIAQKLGANSIIITAILVDAVSQNKLQRSKRKVGTMGYYFYSNQLQTMQKKIVEFLTPQDKELLQHLMKENVIGEFEVQPEAAVALSNLEDLIGGLNLDFRGTPVRCWYTPDMDEKKAREIALGKLENRFGKEKAAPAAEPKEAEAKPEPPKVPVKAAAPAKKRGRKKKTAYSAEVKKAAEIEKDEFRNIVYPWLENQNIDIEKEKILKPGKDVELEVKVPTPIGKQRYVVRILNKGKKGVSKDDVSSIGMQAVTKRVPVIIISATGFAKSAQKYWKKELQDLVSLVSREDLD